MLFQVDSVSGSTAGAYSNGRAWHHDPVRIRTLIESNRVKVREH
jgi:hypothetical protein